MISVVLILTACYLAIGTLLAFVLGRFMHRTSQREEEAINLRADLAVRPPVQRKTA